MDEFNSNDIILNSQDGVIFTQDGHHDDTEWQNYSVVANEQISNYNLTSFKKPLPDSLVDIESELYHGLIENPSLPRIDDISTNYATEVPPNFSIEVPVNNAIDFPNLSSQQPLTVVPRILPVFGENLEPINSRNLSLIHI